MTPSIAPSLPRYAPRSGRHGDRLAPGLAVPLIMALSALGWAGLFVASRAVMAMIG